MAGFFKVFYDIENWEHWHNPIIVAVWMHLLQRAQWNKKHTRYKGIKQERGQALIGREEFADDCGISVQQLRTALNTLKSTNEITINSTNKGTVITIVNYAKWQDMAVQSTSNSTSNITIQQPSSNHPVTNEQPLSNKDNKDNKDINRESEPYKSAEERGLNMEMFSRLRNKEWA